MFHFDEPRRVGLVAAILVISGVASARADFIPNDPLYPSQWHSQKIGLPQAWDYSRGLSSVVVAVLDTGVISDEPDLAGRLLPAVSATGLPPFSDDDLKASPILHHGTEVASAVAMGIDNVLGGAGVGNFSILPITVTNSSGTNASFSIAQGIRMAAAAGARVINVSHTTLSYALLDDAAAYARTKGALTFVAAGNGDSEVDLGDFPNLIFVSGTDRDDNRWSNGGGVGSSFGPYVNLAAPADDIIVADYNFDGTLWNPVFVPKDGTSFAAPLAAGAAALAWSINPTLTADQVLTMLYSTAVDLGDPGWDEVFGNGRINIGALAAAAAASVPEPATAALLAIGLVTVAAARRRVARATRGSGGGLPRRDRS